MCCNMMCDLTIAADNAWFSQTGPKVGSFDGSWGASYMARIVGQKKAQGDLVPLPPLRRQTGPRHGAGHTVVPWPSWSVKPCAGAARCCNTAPWPCAA